MSTIAQQPHSSILEPDSSLLDAVLAVQDAVIDLAEQLADAAQATQSRPLSCATAHTMQAIGDLHEAAEAVAAAVSS